MNKMNLKLFKSLLLIVCLLVSINVSAYNFEEDGIYYEITSSQTVSITYRQLWEADYSGVVQIPETVSHSGTIYTVTAIGAAAFQVCTGLTSVSIPNSVTKIENSAFYGCSALVEITFPNSVNSIGDGVFSGCSSLAEVTFGNGVAKIGVTAFSDCKALTSLVIPNNVVSIDSHAFAHCENLTELTISDGTSVLDLNFIPGADTFEGCPIEKLYLGRDLGYSYTYSPFREIQSLKSVVVGDDVTFIGDMAFYDCNNLTEVVIGNSVTSIGNGAFSECTNLTKVVIPNSVSSVLDDAFRDCSNLEEVTFGSGLMNISFYSFAGCNSLTSVTFPNSVVSIQQGAFDGCTNLTEVVFSDGTDLLKVAPSAFDGCPIEKLYLGREYSVLYSYSPFWEKTSLKNVVIGDLVTLLDDYAFGGCTSITSVTSLNPIPPTISNDATFDNITYQNATLYVPLGSKSSYQQAPYWKNFFNIQEEGTDGVNVIAIGKQERDVIYTLNGVRLHTAKPSDLPTGIYVVNGKKYIVK